MEKTFEEHAVLDVRAVCSRTSLTMEELLKEFVVYVATTYIKRYGRQLLVKVLSCEREACNAHDDCNAVAVKVTGTTDIVGHLSWKVSRVCSLFLKEHIDITARFTSSYVLHIYHVQHLQTVKFRCGKHFVTLIFVAV